MWRYRTGLHFVKSEATVTGIVAVGLTWVYRGPVAKDPGRETDHAVQFVDRLVGIVHEGHFQPTYGVRVLISGLP